MSRKDSYINPHGIGLFSLIGLVISSCIGSGVFALTGQLADVASPGAILIGWMITGLGFLALAFSIQNIACKQPDINGVFSYAEEGFGPFAGFLSGWGYWLSSWMGNVAFATMMMQTVGYFFPQFASGNNVNCIVIASLVMWGLTFLVINGIETASFINALVMMVKVAAIIIFIAFCFISFRMGVFTSDFWGRVHDNLILAGELDAPLFGSTSHQVASTLLIMMWSFIGVEGASVVSKRAKRPEDAGKATIIGILTLLFLYICTSILPYGYMSYIEVGAMNDPALLYVFDHMVPGVGGIFISLAIIVSILGSWLSFTIIPPVTTDVMSEHHLVPARWGTRNKNGAPEFSLILVALCTQFFLISLLVSNDAYTFAFSMCTVSIIITWGFIAAYQIKLSWKNREYLQLVIGVVALAFQVAGLMFAGFQYLLLTCAGYIPGFFLYKKARKENNFEVFSKAEQFFALIITACGVVGLVLLSLGIITF